MNKKIVLYGISGVYNYGCEAIVRGTVNIIKSKYPDAEITYISFREKDDIKRLKNVPIKIIPVKKVKHSILKRIINRIRIYFNISHTKMLQSIDTSWIDTHDIVLIIGGDIYNLLPSEMYKNKKRYTNSKINLGKRIKQKGKTLILWGASTGPFDSNPAAKKAYLEHYKNDMDFIVAREMNTVNYLSKNYISNCQLYSDPAFAVESPVKNSFNQNLTIGINLSPLSARLTYNSISSEETIKEQSELIENIINHYNCNIVLIPHVVCDFDEKDDDLRYLKKIYDNIKFGKERVRIINTDPGFVGIKDELLKCDIVLAARMHCAINAISCAIPTVFIGYSDKSSGMCNYVYGNLENYIDLIEFNKNFLFLQKIVDDKELINEYLQKRIIEIRECAFDAINTF